MALLSYLPQELKADKEMMQHALRQGARFLVGLKVVLLSGRCCDEIFHFHVADRKVVLRRCAELLDLDPDHTERSGALMRGTVEVQENCTTTFWLRLRVEALGTSSLLQFAKRASNVSEESTGNIAKRRLLVNPYGLEFKLNFC